MATNLDDETVGAWIVHHSRKIKLDVSAPAEFPTIDEAGKATELLISLGQSADSTLTWEETRAVAKSVGLNPKYELYGLLNVLKEKRLIETSNEEVRVLGVSNRSALRQASRIFNESTPSKEELACLTLGELTSKRPQRLSEVSEYIGDTYKITATDTKDLLRRSVEVRFVDSEGDDEDKILFNGNLFKRDTIQKTNNVISNMSSDEQSKCREFIEYLEKSGCVEAQRAERTLGAQLFEKLKAAGFVEINLVSNERGDHAFVNSPGAFHKFVNPLIDDSFDMAKALVSAITYGMTRRKTVEGKIQDARWILNALLNGRRIGSAPAIGQDYNVLERNRVVKIYHVGNGYFDMELLKYDVGELALEVLSKGEAHAQALSVPPSAPMTDYKGPEHNRIVTRKSQGKAGRRQVRDIVEALRGGRSV